MGHSVTTKFSIGDTAYVMDEATRQGVLAGGFVDQIRVDVGGDGTTIPTIWYRMKQTLAFEPPGGYWSERELGTRFEADAAKKSYHERMAAYHDLSQG